MMCLQCNLGHKWKEKTPQQLNLEGKQEEDEIELEQNWEGQDIMACHAEKDACLLP